jgi:hypothetical protein
MSLLCKLFGHKPRILTFWHTLPVFHEETFVECTRCDRRLA